MPLSQAALLQQVERIHKKPANRTCAECEQRDSCWASIIHAPVKGGREMGVFICGRCYKHHSSLGMKFVVVKSLSASTPWTQEEVKIFEQSGNDAVNAIFESKLLSRDRDELKEIVTSDRLEEAEARLTFITRKYKHLRYYCEKDYKRKVAMLALEDAEEDDYDPSERVRDGRRAMLLGGTPRNLPPKNRTDDLSASSTHSTRSMRTSRTQDVLNRAHSQKNLSMKKSLSAKNLMGRLNNISLSSPSPRMQAKKDALAAGGEKQTKEETSSTDTGATETSESSEENDPSDAKKKAMRKTASMDERSSARNLMANFRQSSVRGMKKSQSSRDMAEQLAENRQSSLRGLKKSLSGLNLSKMAGGGRSSSARNLFQLPAALSSPKTTSTESSNNNAEGPSALERSPSQRSRLRKSFSGRNLQKENSPMRKSFSGRTLLMQDQSANQEDDQTPPPSAPPPRRNLRKTLSKEDDNQQSPGRRKPGRAKSMRNLMGGSGGGGRQGLKKSLSGRSLSPGGPIRTNKASGSDSASRPGMKKSMSFRVQRPARDNAGGGTSHSSRLQRRTSGRNLLLGDTSPDRSVTNSERMPSLALGDVFGAGPNQSEQNDTERETSTSANPQQSTQRGRGREKSIMVKELEADMLCPSRRDLYDPDAKGLALLMAASGSIMGLSYSAAPGESMSRSGPMGRSLSPQRRPLDAVEAIQEGDEDSENDEAPMKRSSGHEPENDKRSSHSGRRNSTDSSRNDIGGSSRSSHNRKRDSSSRRERSRSPSSRSHNSDKNDRRDSHGRRRRSRSRSNDSRRSHNRDSHGRRSSHDSRHDRRRSRSRSNDSRRSHKRDSHGRRSSQDSRNERRRSRSRSKDSHRPHRKDSHGRRSSHESSRHDSHHSRRHRDDDRDRERSSHRDRRDERMDYARFYRKVDRFIDSVGDVREDDFWMRMIEKWVDSA